MEDELKELGYTVDYALLEKDVRLYTAAGTADNRRQWCSVVLYIAVLAYQAGVEGRAITDLFPYLHGSSPRGEDAQRDSTGGTA